MTARIADQHPRLVAELATHVKGWSDLYDGGEAWVLDVLAGFQDRGEYEIAPTESASGHPVIIDDSLVDVFLNRTEVAEWLGVAPATLSRYNLPPADAMIGRARGWRKSTIINWDGSRPGRGRWANKEGATQ